MFLVIKDPSVGHICFVFMIKAKKKNQQPQKGAHVCLSLRGAWAPVFTLQSHNCTNLGLARVPGDLKLVSVSD